MSEKLATSNSCDDVSELNNELLRQASTESCTSSCCSGEFDSVKLHMLGLISNVMVWYHLLPNQVESSYNELIAHMSANNSSFHSFNSDEVDINDVDFNKPDDNDDATETKTPENIIDTENLENTKTECVIDTKNIPEIETTETIENNKNTENNEDQLKTIWVKTRREFRDKILDGFKICPRYSTCVDSECEYFHVKKENICNHSINDNYCNDNVCDKIIVKKCRRGNKCKDSSCSFRHLNRE